MSESILTGIFTLVGVIVGGFSSWIIAIYANRKSHAKKVLEKQQALCLNMLGYVNMMIEKLPKNNNELSKFKTYLLSEFYPKRNPMVLAEEMLYLPDDIRSTYMTICLFAENDLTIDCNYEIICQKIIIYRNVFLAMLRDDFKISSKSENSEKKKKRFDKLINEQINSITAEQIDAFD